jgi:hypothetical protein
LGNTLLVLLAVGQLPIRHKPDVQITSKWAAMAREGKKVMQFLDGGRYVAVVVDGKMKTYG